LLRFSEHLSAEQGDAMFHHACAMGLEGIVSKRLTSRYKSGACKSWVKVKNPEYEGGRARRMASMMYRKPAGAANERSSRMSDEPSGPEETSIQRRARHAREGVEAVAEHAAKARAVDDKTARLKARRLARDEAERVDAAAKARVSPHAKQPSSKRKRSIKVENLNAENDG
jgi:hypothetical protein